MTMMIAMIFYIGGIALSLIILHLFGKKMGIPDYDIQENKDEYEWNSNNVAYSAFSLGWPLFWGVIIITEISRFIVMLLKNIQLVSLKLFKKSKENEENC